MKQCNKCGHVNDDSQAFCGQCGNKLDATAQQPNSQPNQYSQNPSQYNPYQQPYYTNNPYYIQQQIEEQQKHNKKATRKTIIIIVSIFIILTFFAIIGASDDTEPTNNTNNSYSTSEESTISKSDFINSCKEYTYKEIARDPNNYKGKPAKFKGKVIQVQENGNKVILRVDITAKANEFVEGGYLYEDTIYVEYTRKSETESRILEDDIVAMYGTIKGLETYQSIFGEEISLPSFNAEYIDIETK